MHLREGLRISPSAPSHPPILPERMQDVAITLVLATASIAFAPLLHGLSPLLAIAALTLIACAIVIAVPAYAPAIAIFVLLFQNLFVSIMSPMIADNPALDFIKGYNFLACSVMWLVTLLLYVARQRDNSSEVNRLMIASTCALGAVGLYFIYGFLQNGFAAVVYLRNIVLPIFLFQLALLTASSFETRVTPTLVTIGVLFLLCGYVELMFRDFWLHITNGYAYWQFDEIKATNSGTWEREMRATGQVLVELKDRFSFDFLNTPLLEGFGLSTILRVFGPTLSAISYAYGVCFFILFLFSVKRPLLAVAAIPLAIFCSVKGALIMVLFVAGSWLATRLIGAKATLGVGLVGLVVYAAFGLRLGLEIGDYHVIGFMGGWNGFLQQPFGRGLGSGGNLSENFAAIDWSAAQAAGAVDGAAESAVGVLLYQMGIAAAVPLWFYCLVGIRAWRLYARSGILTQGLAGFGMFIILTNGLFQEEALFAPPALGLLTCLAGLVIGNAARAQKRAVTPSPAAVERATTATPQW
jgi:hypothetical protein